MAISEEIKLNIEQYTPYPVGARKTSTIPKMDGEASIGDEKTYAAGDHVHPSDTSKLSTNRLGAADGVCPLDSSAKINEMYLPDSISSEFDTMGSKVNVLELRMDSFTNLEEGSTTGDAELIDGRVGADAVTYPNIGDAIRTQVSNLKSELNLIGEDNVEYAITTRAVSGTSSWNAAYIDTGITPVCGETYYLEVGSVTNCMTSVCARMYFLQDNTEKGYVTLTTDDVANGVIASKLNDSVVVNKIRLVLYRNASGSTVESGTTTFTNVTIKRKYSDTVSIATKDFDLTENDDYKAIDQAVNDTQTALDSEMSELHDMWNEQFESNIVYSKDTQTVSGTASYNGAYINTGITPVVGQTYYLHIDSVEDCKSTTCARLNFNNGGTNVSYVTMSVSDVTGGVSISKLLDNTIVDNIQLVLYRNATSSTVEAGTTTFKGVRITTGSADVEYTLQTYWAGKKIAWFGTSIPAGSYDSDGNHRYPNIVGSMLGATVFNESVGSSSISRTIPSAIVSGTNPYGFDTRDFEYAARCLTNTIEMQNWMIANYNSGFFTGNVPATMDAATQARLLSYSYENKLDKYITGGSVGNVDLYVFDQGYNEYYHNRDVEALESQYGIDTRYCFDGGMNFLIRRILTANPDAKIVVISHYTDNATDSIHDTTWFVEKVRDAQIAVCKRWGIKFINIFEKLGWSGQMITTTGYWDNDTHEWVNSGGTSQNIQIKDIHVRDTVHPYTDASGKSNNRIADVIAAELASIIR